MRNPCYGIKSFILLTVLILPFRSYAQLQLPVKVGEPKKIAMKKLAKFKNPSVRDTSLRWRIDSVYEGVKFQDIPGRLFVGFTDSARSTIKILQWESLDNVSDEKKLDFLESLEKKFGGNLDAPLDAPFTSWLGLLPHRKLWAIYDGWHVYYNEEIFEQRKKGSRPPWSGF